MARDAIALTASSLTSAGLGLVCYVMAARLFPQGIVGRAVAITSAMVLLSGIASLDLATVLQRFLPGAGPTGGRLVVGSYIAVTTASFLVTIPFVAFFGAPLFGPDRLVDGVWFSFAVAAWSIFSLQDMVLLGMGRAPLIPVENLLFGLARLALLAAPVGGGVTAMVASWIAPVVALVLLINAIVILRIYPDYRRRQSTVTTPWDMREVARFTAANYLARLCGVAVANSLPLLVVARLGDAANASFYMAWTIGFTLELLVVNFSSSLLVQGAAKPNEMPTLARTALRQQAALVVPVVLIIIVFAREILLAFGRTYADDATSLLRLVALGVLPTICTYIYVAAARLDGRSMEVVVVVALGAGGFLALAWVGLNRHGLTGLGGAYLAVEASLALVLLPRVYRLLTADGGVPDAAPSTSGLDADRLGTPDRPSAAAGSHGIPDGGGPLRQATRLARGTGTGTGTGTHSGAGRHRSR